MTPVPVAVVGAGQAGLAVSRLLTEADVDHVVLERGRAAEHWRSARWRSLRLLTPNWMSRLPGWRYAGPDPAGYMSAREVADYLSAYAVASRAPVVEGAAVESLRPAPAGYRIATAAGHWTTRAVVVATGWSDLPSVPAAAARLDRSLVQLTAASYRDPAGLPDAGVLVVGASASGVQLADEIAATGRPVTLAVGRHARVPRRYRGMEILWWLDAMGLLDRRVRPHVAPADTPPDPSLQLVGRPDDRAVDLPALQARGITLTGRLLAADGTRLRFADDLPLTTRAADDHMAGLLHRIDSYAAAVGLADEVLPAPPALPGIRTAQPPVELDLAAAGIGAVVWATGYRRSYPWLHVPVLDAAGEIRHVAGTTAARGLHVVGMRMQTRRNSTFLDGVRHDAAAVVGRLLADLGAGVPREALRSAA
ncbi:MULTISPECIES: flavin-containing monooxygenase [unclassified Geodermatophilus]|uniref:flavin-containing monooxygenase n=1 Tax=unclassified Geodermatophilus TaxID=2637632 RepID=UPI003EF03921